MPSTLTNRINLFLALLLLATGVQAKQSDYKEKVYVDSIRQQAELADNKVTFFEDVIITQGTIKITAVKVEVIRRGDKGAEEMIAYGNPATFYQVLDNEKPVHAEATQINYKLKEKLVVLTGNAQLKQEDSQVNGDVIRYDIEKQQMMAESARKGSRVKTVFLPEQVQEQGKGGK